MPCVRILLRKHLFNLIFNSLLMNVHLFFLVMLFIPPNKFTVEPLHIISGRKIDLARRTRDLFILVNKHCKKLVCHLPNKNDKSVSVFCTLLKYIHDLLLLYFFEDREFNEIIKICTQFKFILVQWGILIARKMLLSIKAALGSRQQ